MSACAWTVGGFYSRPAPWLARRSKSSLLLRSTATGLGRCAQQGVGRRTDGQYAAAVRRDSRSYATARAPRWPARRGLTTRASRQWAVSQHARRGDAARGVGRQAARRRSGGALVRGRAVF
jgi:hypothetical protein